MATPIIKNTTVVGVMVEVTEGTYLAPAAATDYVATLDGIEANGSKEVVERSVLTSSIGKVAPRAGLESFAGAIPFEMKASGTEGGAPEGDKLFKSALGTSRTIATRSATKAAGNTASVLQIEDADISKYNLYDMVVVLEAGAHHPCYVSAKSTGAGTATITVVPSKPSGVFSDSVEVSKAKTYLTANSGHPTLSASVYWANEILQKGTGCRVTQLALENFSTGQIASFGCSLQGLNFDRTNTASPFTPTYQSALPPIVVSNACVYQNGTALKVNAVSWALSNTASFVEEICAGRTSSRITERVVTGSMNPYMDDADISQFTKFDLQSGYTLFAWAGNPSAVAGELDLGSVCMFVLPNCVTTELPTGDIDGLLVDEISFNVNRGASGTIEELYLGFV